jgi:hypothetical protein
VHPVQHTPYLAGAAQTVYGCAFVLLCAYFKLDVMSVVLPLTTAPAAIGIVAVQCLTCLAVIGFFSSQPDHANVWQRLVAPILSFAAIGWVLYVIVRNMALLTGGETAANHLIPLGMLAVALSGLVFAFWIRRQRPSLYKNFARVLTEG